MKLNINKKYFLIGFIAFCVIALSIIFYLVFSRLSGVSAAIDSFMSILHPVIMGIIIAYLLTPLVNFLERRLFFPLYLRKHDGISEKWLKFFRVVSIILTLAIISLLFTVLFKSVIPELSLSLKGLANQFPVYVSTAQDWINDMMEKNDYLFKLGSDLLSDDSNIIGKNVSTTLVETINGKVFPQVQNFFSNISVGVINTIVGIWNFFIGAIISIYLLLKKELFAAQGKKIVYSLFNLDKANNLIKDARFISDTFIGFISGKLIDSLIIGILCFIGVSILDIPYKVLISVIIGVTNIIPFFGPFFGAIPSAILVLMVDPLKCLYLIIFIFILQQLDGNVIGPKILGESTGISGFWVIFAITLFGGLWGVMGMVVGIPIVAVVYAMIKRVTERRLKARNLPTESWDYAPIKRINDDNTVVELFEADVKNFKWKKKEKSDSENNIKERIKSRLKRTKNDKI